MKHADSHSAAYAISDARALLAILLKEEPVIAGNLHLMKAVTTQLFVDISTLLAMMKDAGAAYEAVNDLPAGVEVENVHQLIRMTRNACCHFGSPGNHVGSAVIRFSFFRGRIPRAIVIGGVAIGCDYEDDLAIVFGKFRVYARRHLSAALDAASGHFGISG